MRTVLSVGEVLVTGEGAGVALEAGGGGDEGDQGEGEDDGETHATGDVVLDRLRVEYGEYRSIAVSSSALSSHDTEQRIIDMTHNFRTNKYIFINLFFYLDDCLNWENLKMTI